MTIIELLIRGRPLSLQTRNRRNLQAWKRFVAGEAAKVWRTRPTISSGRLHLTLVYLCRTDPPDTDNIIKPIQDALATIVMANDNRITDVESHRRYRPEILDLTRIPTLLLSALLIDGECVYVRLSDAPPLEDLL